MSSANEVRGRRSSSTTPADIEVKYHGASKSINIGKVGQVQPKSKKAKQPTPKKQ